jgi:hypothetical protein
MVRAVFGVRAAHRGRSHDRLSCRVQPDRSHSATALGLVPHAGLCISRVADWADRGLRGIVLSDAGGGAGNARLALTGMGVCRDHALKRARPYPVHDFGTHGFVGDFSASGAGILFFAVLITRIALVDGPAAAHGASGFSTPKRLLSLREVYTMSGKPLARTGMHNADPAIIFFGA